MEPLEMQRCFVEPNVCRLDSAQEAFARAEIMATIPRTDGRDGPRPLVYGRRAGGRWVYNVTASPEGRAYVRRVAARAR